MAKRKVTTTSCCSGNHWGPWGPGQCGPGPWGPIPGPRGYNYDPNTWVYPGPRPNTGSFGSNEPWWSGPWID